MTQNWTTWHKVVSLRPDLKSGEFSLAAFTIGRLPVVARLVPTSYEGRGFHRVH
jgi:hypothetical protein